MSSFRLMKASRRARHPRARRENLVVERLGDETLVYDVVTQKAHCLNATAAAIWDACDGRRDEAAIAARLGPAHGGRAAVGVVRHGLRGLFRARLLEGPAPGPLSVGRRGALKKIAAGMALPVVASIVAPDVAEAATCPLGNRRITPSLCVVDSRTGAVPAQYIGCCCTNNRLCTAAGNNCVGAAC